MKAAQLLARGRCLEDVAQLSLEPQPIRPFPQIGQVKLEMRVHHDAEGILKVCRATGFEFKQDQVLGGRNPDRHAQDM